MNHSPVILRRRQVEERVGLKRSAIFERVKDGTFPLPVKLGTGKCKTIGWVEAEIIAWIEQRIEQRDARCLM